MMITVTLAAKKSLRKFTFKTPFSDDDGCDKRPYEAIALEESMLDDSDYELVACLTSCLTHQTYKFLRYP